MEKAGDFLKKVFVESADSGVDKYLPLFRNWKSIVGSDLKKHVTLLDIHNDILVTETVHPGWKQAVFLKKQAILKRINTYYPGLHIKDIRVNIVKKSTSSPEPVDRSGQVMHSMEEEETSSSGIEEVLSHMTDSELKKALQKLYASRPLRPPGRSPKQEES